jgi:hypothetical protein
MTEQKNVDGAERLLADMFNLYVAPEIERRLRDNEHLEIVLRNFQVIFYLDGRAPQCRINEEVRIEMVIEYDNSDRHLEVGAAYSPDDVPGKVERIQLALSEDPNCGHFSAAFWNDSWHIAFDFRYNREHASAPAETGHDFLISAKLTRENGLWAPFVDNLFSAIELSIKALLWTGPHGAKFAPKMQHGPIHEAFSQFSKTGNVTKAEAKVFEELRGLRSGARYAYAPEKARWQAADRWLAAVTSLMTRADAMVKDTRITPDDDDSEVQNAQ